jgi:hypothetical protein
MCASPVLYYDTSLHDYIVNDSLSYGMLDVELAGCDTLMNGLAIHFLFRQGSKIFLIPSVNLPQIKEYVSGVFYMGMSLDKYSFIKDNIFYDEPFRIDTALAIRFYNSNRKINPWLKRRIEDSLLKKK